MLFVTPKWKHKNFFAEIDAMCPAWVETTTVDDVALYGSNEPSQRMMRSLYYATMDEEEREVKAGDPCWGEFSMPWQQYVRAMDPAGNIGPLHIKCSRIAADDSTGFGSAQIAKKRLAGWLICERVSDAQAMGVVFDTNGKEEQEYAEFLRSEFVARRKKRMQHDAREAAKVRTEAERHMIEMQQKQTEAINSQVETSRAMVADTVAALVPAITAAVIAAMNANANQAKAKQ